MLAFLHYNFIIFCASLTKMWFGHLQQGSAADVAMCAMLEIAKNACLKQLGWKLLLQVMFMLFSSSLLPPYFILDPKKTKEGREKENSSSRIPTHFPLFNSAGSTSTLLLVTDYVIELLNNHFVSLMLPCFCLLLSFNSIALLDYVTQIKVGRERGWGRE